MFEKVTSHWLYPYIVFPIGYAIIIATSYAYQKALFDWSLTAIESVQKGISLSTWKAWKLYTDVGGANL